MSVPQQPAPIEYFPHYLVCTGMGHGVWLEKQGTKILLVSLFYDGDPGVPPVSTGGHVMCVNGAPLTAVFSYDDVIVEGYLKDLQPKYLTWTVDCSTLGPGDEVTVVRKQDGAVFPVKAVV